MIDFWRFQLLEGWRRIIDRLLNRASKVTINNYWKQFARFLVNRGGTTRICDNWAAEKLHFVDRPRARLEKNLCQAEGISINTINSKQRDRTRGKKLGAIEVTERLTAPWCAKTERGLRFLGSCNYTRSFPRPPFQLTSTVSSVARCESWGEKKKKGKEIQQQKTQEPLTANVIYNTR